MDHDRAVVEAVAVAQRRADDQHREEIDGCLDQPRDRPPRRRRARHPASRGRRSRTREAQLGEDGDGDGLGVALARRGEHRLGVRGRVGDRDGNGAGGDAREAVPVGALEREGCAHGPSLAGGRSASTGDARAGMSGLAASVEVRKGRHAIHRRRRPDRLERERPQGGRRVRVRVAAGDRRAARVASPRSSSPRISPSQRAGRLGGEHERRVLGAYRAALGERRRRDRRGAIVGCRGPRRAVARTNAALASDDATVIYQAAFSTHDFVGFADFLVRDRDGSGQPAAGSCRTRSSRGARG